MRTRITFLALMAVLFSPMAAWAVPILQTTDFIADGSRTGFNSFEAIPNDGTFYTGGTGPYIEGGISVEQINGDTPPDIWVNCCGISDGVHSWYPNGGDFGYTEITMANGSDFFDFGLYSDTGDGGNELILFDLLLNGTSVLTGSTAGAAVGAFQYVGFSGGGFDTIRIRNDCANSSGTGDLYDGGLNCITLDGLETTGSTAAPEPGILSLLGLGLLGMGVASRRRKV